MKERKPMTYEEQVAVIRRKGFIIYDDEVGDCIAFLRKVNYYRFSAYFLPFMKNDRTFERGISFFRLQRIYEFDSRLRSLIFEIIEDVEVYLRTQISYYVSQKYGAFGHLNDAMYSRRHDEHNFLGRIRRCVEQNRDSPIIIQSQKKNDGRVPLWIIVEFFSVGMLTYFFLDMKSADQKEIAEKIYRARVKEFESWLHCLTDLRNRCAHYLSLYGWTFAAAPRLPQDVACFYEADRSLFPQLLVLKFLYPDEREWMFKMMAVLKPLMLEYEEDIELRHIGFPENWENLLAGRGGTGAADKNAG